MAIEYFYISSMLHFSISIRIFLDATIVYIDNSICLRWKTGESNIMDYGLTISGSLKLKMS